MAWRKKTCAIVVDKNRATTVRLLLAPCVGFADSPWSRAFELDSSVAERWLILEPSIEVFCELTRKAKSMDGGLCNVACNNCVLL